MNNTNFYCQQKCTDVDFSIDEWNKAFKTCIDLNFDEKATAEILEGKECDNQCFDCMADVGERRKKTQEIVKRLNSC